MHVKIGNEKVEFGVSDGGMFYDVATRTISATTLKGLTKKIKESKAKHPPIAVIHDYTNKKGSVTGRPDTKSYYRHRYFTVIWEDGSSTEEDGNSLRRELNPEETAELKRLKDTEAAANQVLERARSAVYAIQGQHSTYKSKFCLKPMLETSFPI